MHLLSDNNRPARISEASTREGDDGMEAMCREVGRTVRYAMESTDRTVRLIAISIVAAILIALLYLLLHPAA